MLASPHRRVCHQWHRPPMNSAIRPRLTHIGDDVHRIYRDARLRSLFTIPQQSVGVNEFERGSRFIGLFSILDFQNRICRRMGVCDRRYASQGRKTSSGFPVHPPPTHHTVQYETPVVLAVHTHRAARWLGRYLFRIQKQTPAATVKPAQSPMADDCLDRLPSFIACLQFPSRLWLSGGKLCAWRFFSSRMRPSLACPFQRDVCMSLDSCRRLRKAEENASRGFAEVQTRTKGEISVASVFLAKSGLVRAMVPTRNPRREISVPPQHGFFLSKFMGHCRPLP